MKRTPLKRGKGLARKAPLKASKGLTTKKPLAGGGGLRRTELAKQSKKRQREARLRIKLVEELLDLVPVCERCKTSRSTDVHEPLLRSRGGDFLDPGQCVALCRPCHSWAHGNPREATAEGWMKHAWDVESDDPCEVSAEDGAR